MPLTIEQLSVIRTEQAWNDVLKESSLDDIRIFLKLMGPENSANPPSKLEIHYAFCLPLQDNPKKTGVELLVDKIMELTGPLVTMSNSNSNSESDGIVNNNSNDITELNTNISTETSLSPLSQETLLALVQHNILQPSLEAAPGAFIRRNPLRYHSQFSLSVKNVTYNIINYAKNSLEMGFMDAMEEALSDTDDNMAYFKILEEGINENKPPVYNKESGLQYWCDFASGIIELDRKKLNGKPSRLITLLVDITNFSVFSEKEGLFDQWYQNLLYCANIRPEIYLRELVDNAAGLNAKLLETLVKMVVEKNNLKALFLLQVVAEKANQVQAEKFLYKIIKKSFMGNLKDWYNIFENWSNQYPTNTHFSEVRMLCSEKIISADVEENLSQYLKEVDALSKTKQIVKGSLLNILMSKWNRSIALPVLETIAKNANQQQATYFLAYIIQPSLMKYLDDSWYAILNNWDVQYPTIWHDSFQLKNHWKNQFIGCLANKAKEDSKALALLIKILNKEKLSYDMLVSFNENVDCKEWCDEYHSFTFYAFLYKPAFILKSCSKQELQARKNMLVNNKVKITVTEEQLQKVLDAVEKYGLSSDGISDNSSSSSSSNVGTTTVELDVAPLKKALYSMKAKLVTKRLLSNTDVMPEKEDIAGYLYELNDSSTEEILERLNMPAFHEIVVKYMACGSGCNDVAEFSEKNQIFSLLYLIAVEISSQHQAKKFLDFFLRKLSTEGNELGNWLDILDKWLEKYPQIYQFEFFNGSFIENLVHRREDSKAVEFLNKILNTQSIQSALYSKIGNNFSAVDLDNMYFYRWDLLLVFYAFIQAPTLFLDKCVQWTWTINRLEILLLNCGDSIRQISIEQLFITLNAVNEYASLKLLSNVSNDNSNTDEITSNDKLLDFTPVQKALYCLLADKIIESYKTEKYNEEEQKQLFWNLARISFEINIIQNVKKITSEQWGTLKALHGIKRFLDYSVYLATTSQKDKKQSIGMQMINTHQHGVFGGDTHTMTAVIKYNAAVTAGKETREDAVSALISAAHDNDMSQPINAEALAAHIKNVNHYRTKIHPSLVAAGQSIRAAGAGSMSLFSVAPRMRVGENEMKASDNSNNASANEGNAISMVSLNAGAGDERG